MRLSKSSGRRANSTNDSKLEQLLLWATDPLQQFAFCLVDSKYAGDHEGAPRSLSGFSLLAATRNQGEKWVFGFLRDPLPPTNMAPVGGYLEDQFPLGTISEVPC